MILSPEDMGRCQWIAHRNDRVLQIVKEVADASGIHPEDIIGTNRHPAVCYARDLVCYIAKRDGHSSAQIGQALGRRDRTTILCAVKREAERRGE